MPVRIPLHRPWMLFIPGVHLGWRCVLYLYREACTNIHRTTHVCWSLAEAKPRGSRSQSKKWSESNMWEMTQEAIQPSDHLRSCFAPFLPLLAPPTSRKYILNTCARLVRNYSVDSVWWLDSLVIDMLLLLFNGDAWEYITMHLTSPWSVKTTFRK